MFLGRVALSISRLAIIEALRYQDVTEILDSFFFLLPDEAVQGWHRDCNQFCPAKRRLQLNFVPLLWLGSWERT